MAPLTHITAMDRQATTQELFGTGVFYAICPIQVPMEQASLESVVGECSS
jgi:hypothetical protein